MKGRKSQPISLAMNTGVTSLAILFLSWLFYSCGTVKPYYEKHYENWESATPPDTAQIKYSVYLIGDAGEQTNNARMVPAFKLLRNMIYTKIDTLLPGTIDPRNQQVCSDTSFYCQSERNNNSVIFLGDNIYHHGLPPEDAKDRKKMEKKIDAQLNIVKDFKGNVYFIPGNHDWNQSGRGGLAAVNRQEKYIEKYLNNTNSFLPSNGCPGPVERQISNDLTIIFIDSEWWLYPHEDEKPVGSENDCNVNDKFDFIIQVSDMIRKNKNKNILIVQHHPLFTNGNHGGHYSIKDYIFPLTLVRHNLYIPLPGLGSIYPLMRKYGISPEDLSHPAYQQLKDAMLSVMENQKNIVFAAGHEHNLQYRKVGDLHHIVSGSGCKDKYAIKGAGAHFVHDDKGFARVNYYDNNQVWLEFWEPVADGTTGKLVFRTPLYALTTESVKLPKDFECRDSTITVAASNEYKASGLKKSLFGEHYRAEWGTPVKAHLLDLKCEKGGLTPTAKGGGKQTTSIRLISPDSTEYTLRTVSKDPSSLIPTGLKRTFANDILQDQMSSAHPYGALAIPLMADAVGVYHANPELYYVPHSPELGIYLEDVGGKLAILEERADGDLSKVKSFGNSKNVVSVKTMYKNVIKDNRNRVDQQFYLKARIFDMLIGDWDRHDDNWRWGEFKKGDTKIYKAIPRDRDQVFVKFDGVFPYIFRKFAVRNFNHFTSEFYDMKGLNKSANFLDKTLLTEPDMKTWLMTADTIKRLLTDSVIDQAMRKLPPEIYAISGKSIAEKIKARRDKLESAVFDYYRIMASDVEVIGSDESERFEVTRINDTETRVVIYGLDSLNNYSRKIYDRTFREGETKKVILYGLNGDDHFILSGQGKKGPGIKLIGGKGKDTYIDSTDVLGRKRMTKVLDYKGDKNVISDVGDMSTHLSKNKSVNEFDSYKELVFKRNSLRPRLFAEYNNDFGFYTGAGIVMHKYNFGKPPANAEHQLNFHYAGKTGSRIFSYKGDFHSLFTKKLGLKVYLRQSGPDNIINYFGIGNETSWDRKTLSPYQLIINQQYGSVLLTRKVMDFMTVSFGPQYQRTIIDKGTNVVVNGPEDFKTNILGPQQIYGLRLNGTINVLDAQDDPTRGIKLLLKSAVNQVSDKTGSIYSPMSADLSFYLTPRGGTFPMTLGLRLGGALNLGDFPFYEANFIGGTDNLRGYRYNRFAGKSMAYQNLDLRFRLFEFRNYVFTGKWGFLGFIDNARVWNDYEKSTKWHTGYGPGAWINLYSLFVLSGSVGFSEEGRFVTITSGFFF